MKKDTFPLLVSLSNERKSKVSGGIYHRSQIDLAYNSNHIEGSCLSHEQTRYIYETNTIEQGNDVINIDDIIEAKNHFRCFDFIIENCEVPLSETYIKQLHLLLKTGTSDAHKEWFRIGDYKLLPNEVGGNTTVLPKDVAQEVKKLLKEYHSLEKLTFDDILDFHVKFESIHPFQDGNGRVGRLIIFKECLSHNIVPFIITDELKFYYYRGIREWENTKGYLTDTCLTAQDNYKALLDYFQIRY